ncbi:MAG: hypothetical protein HYY91_03710 [Candidatus Omnitrophica bacterium]|nr:hypothetical protein [Candidatus Omnitrophota bacterium]
MTQPVSADFREVDCEAALSFLAESGGITIVLSPKAKELSKPVTMHLVDIPLQQALEYLVKGQSLAYRFDDNAIFVATLDEMEAEPMETKVLFLNQGPGLFATFDPIPETREGVALQSLGVKRLTTVKDILEDVIPSVSGSSFLLDERTGALTVTHAPYYLSQIEDLLRQLDVLPIAVRVQARFLELTITDTDEFGFDAQLAGNVALNKLQGRDGTTKGPGYQFSSLGEQLRRGTKVAFSDFSNQASGNGLNLTFQGILTGTQYSAVLHALTDNTKAKTLSAPQVTTLNNQTAAIKVVTEFVYATQYDASVKKEDLNGDGDFNDVVNGVRETRFVNVPQDFVTKDLGILLNVTPSVGRDLRTIILALKPEVSEKKTDDTFAGEVSLPRFTTRSLATSVVIEDGETVVLGGLMKDTTSKTVTRVPVLSSVPILGGLFKKNSESVERSNLLIFITAGIVRSPGDTLLAQHDAP